MNPKHKILIVEDDELLLDNLITFLSNNGFAVTGVRTAEACQETIRTEDYDLAVIDIGLPDSTDYELVRHLREKTDLKIIVLTARQQIDDKIQGYAAGCDAYFVKPTDSWELKGCINSILRRSDEKESAQLERSNNGCWSFDPGYLSLTSPAGDAINLTTKEGLFLALLIENSGLNVSRNAFFSKLKEEEGVNYDDRALDILVTRLRKKTKDKTGEILPVRTIRAIGYCFFAPIEITDRS